MSVLSKVIIRIGMISFLQSIKMTIKNNLLIRNACSSRLHRLRQRCDLTQGTGKFSRKVVKPEDVDSPFALEIELLLAERAWASAEQITKDNSLSLPRTMANALKHYKRADQHAANLYNLCQHCADQETQLESKAYLGWIRGNYCIKLNHFEDALKNFLSTRAYLYEFRETGSFKHNQILSTYIQEIDPKLQFVLPPVLFFSTFLFLFHILSPSLTHQKLLLLPGAQEQHPLLRDPPPCTHRG